MKKYVRHGLRIRSKRGRLKEGESMSVSIANLLIKLNTVKKGVLH